MSTIKFRGKTELTGEWVYGFFTMGSSVRFEHPKQDERVVPRYLIDDGLLHDVIPETVGQFTGLTDRNGKEIYDGDIIQHRDVKVIVEFYRGAFGYTRLIQHRVRIAPGASNVVQEHVFIPFIGSDDNKYALQFSDGTFFDTDFCKVVGNIHDSPELMKGVGQ